MVRVHGMSNDPITRGWYVQHFLLPDRFRYTIIFIYYHAEYTSTNISHLIYIVINSMKMQAKKN